MSTVNKLMIGIAAGAILGVLYAPDKGSATRRKLSRTGNDIRDRFNCLRDAVSDKISSITDDVEDIGYQELEPVESEIQPSPWQ
jgi:gas vesicle protein